MITLFIISLSLAALYYAFLHISNLLVILCAIDERTAFVITIFLYGFYLKTITISVNQTIREGWWNDWLAPRIAKFALNTQTRRTLDSIRTHTPSKSVLFAIEPHGFACYTVAVQICGYAQHSAFRHELGVKFMRRTRIVGHWIAQWIPVVREIYAAYGVIGCSKQEVERELEARNHVVLLPSGWSGKRDAVERDSGGEGVDVLMRPSHRVGFLSLAARHNALLVPILVPDEQHAFRAYGPSFLHWLLRVPVGRYLFFPRCPDIGMRVMVGTPIETELFDYKNKESMSKLRTLYYDALRELGERNNVNVRLHDMPL